MEQQLKEKLQQIIEANFSKAESEVLVSLVKERDDLSQKFSQLKEDAESSKKLIESKDKELQRLRNEIEAHIKSAEGFKKGAADAIKAHDEMKKNYVDLELKATKESLGNIYKLAEIAFRSPKKVTEFNENIRCESFDYSTGRPTGSYVNSHPVTKVESVE